VVRVTGPGAEPPAPILAPLPAIVGRVKNGREERDWKGREGKVSPLLHITTAC